MVDLQGGTATVTPSPGASLAPSAIFAAIRGAGLRPEGVTIEASGEVRGAEFFLPGAAAPYLRLRAPELPDGTATIRVRILPDGTVELLPR